MSDRKHLEYCVKLGNTIVQDKLIQLEQNGYVEPQIDYRQMQEKDNMSFRERLKNW